MSSFKGSYVHTLDSKGRIHLPAKLRKYISPEANDTFVVTRGLEQCIFAYPLDEWQIYEKQVRNLPPSSGDSRYVLRRLFEYMHEVQLDGQSRIMLPQKLIEFAQLKSEVLIMGVLERLEIWNPENYDQYIQKRDSTYEEVYEQVFKKNSIQA